ncbi:MAG: elongation factor P [Candidatus Nealsonbacteria bacterium]
MISYNELKKGMTIILEGAPYEVLESNHMKKAQRRPVIQTKLRNLFSGGVLERNFKQGEAFEEAELKKLKAKFVYSHKDKYFFSEESNPSSRFDLGSEQLGEQTKFLKGNQPVEALIFNEQVINIALPIKIHLKVVEAPPGIKGDRAQGGTKSVVLETGTVIQAPLFINQGDTIEINTQTQEYVKRAE